MQFASWTEFVNKLSKFEENVKVEIEKFKGDHPQLDKGVQLAVTLLPYPLNEIAKSIYDSFDGTTEEKSHEILNYFNYLKNQGEKHYNNITTKLDLILNKIDDLRDPSTKESSIEKIQEILISTGKSTEQK